MLGPTRATTWGTEVASGHAPQPARLPLGHCGNAHRRGVACAFTSKSSVQRLQLDVASLATTLSERSSALQLERTQPLSTQPLISFASPSASLDQLPYSADTLKAHAKVGGG